ncbi:MAG: response regulator [Deltaproteobacteria bacterium]|nr:response regulator [Deltaproteobacteria bacterium]
MKKTELVLEKYEEDLRRKIEARTSELVAANKQLRCEVEERNRREQELIQADKMISLGILVSGVAHEINNPNNTIMLNTPLLLEIWEGVVSILDRFYEKNGDFKVGGLFYSELRSAVPELFSGIEKSAARIKNIVQGLKNFSRQQPPGASHDVDVNDVIEVTLSLFNNMIKKSTRNFSFHYGDNLPCIRGNAQKLEQVVVNLIQNACQALPDKEKGIAVTTAYDEKSGYVVVKVKDEGIGIPKEVLPHIMDPFFTTKRGKGGTGLGLSVSSKIIREHGGIIDVKSQPGAGTTFKVFLPTNEKKRIVTVLVADDDDQARGIVTEALRDENYLVWGAANGSEACVKLGRNRPDLLVLDIHMPNMDGVEVCRVIKKTKELSGTNVIVVTGLPNSPKVGEIKDMGFKHILYKPVRLPLLLEMIGKVLEKGSPERIVPGRSTNRRHLQ